MKGFPVNSIESNNNIVVSPDEIELGVNILVLDLEHKGKPNKGIIRKLFLLFKKTKIKKYVNNNIKEGFIRLKMGEYYLSLGKFEMAKVNFYAAYDLFKKGGNNHLAMQAKNKYDFL